MDISVSRERSLRGRKPLGDTTSWVNNQSLTPSLDHYTSSPPRIPHHESLKSGGNLKTRNNPGSANLTVENNRLPAVSNEIERDPNRDSQISTVSTNASSKSRRKTHVGPWRLGRTLGKGASGRVRKARHAVTGQDAAIKIVSKHAAKKLQSESLANMDTMINPEFSSVNGRRRAIPFGIEREVVIMKLIEHPHIISLYDVWENRGELLVIEMMCLPRDR